MVSEDCQHFPPRAVQAAIVSKEAARASSKAGGKGISSCCLKLTSVLLRCSTEALVCLFACYLSLVVPAAYPQSLPSCKLSTTLASQLTPGDV